MHRNDEIKTIARSKYVCIGLYNTTVLYSTRDNSRTIESQFCRKKKSRVDVNSNLINEFYYRMYGTVPHLDSKKLAEYCVIFIY